MSDILIQRRIDAPIDRVWTAWTDPSELASWFWPETFETTCEIELTPGGSFRIASSTTGMAVAARCVEVEPPHRLVLEWRWEGETDTTEVEISLSEVDGGTALVVEHRNQPDAQTEANHTQGWNDCLDRLARRD